MLNRLTIENEIEQLLISVGDRDLSLEESRQKFKQELATIIVNAITSATVTVNPGILVQVTPASGTGATTAQGIGSLS